MKTRFSILTILVTFAFLSCKNESVAVKMDYNYSDQPSLIDCNISDSLLVKEALYTFESDIAKVYDPQSNNVRRAYSLFIRNASNGRVDYKKVVTEHSLEVYNALKNSDLWKDGGLNYKNDFFVCIGENIKDAQLKTTYNSLLSSDYMSNNLFGPALGSKANSVINDKYLATFVALDFYFAHLEGVTPQPKLPQAEKADNSPVDFNKTPVKTPQ